MSVPILATKLFIPPPRPGMVLRPHLVERLDEGLCQNPGSGPRLALISAPAGFGKTTLASEWVASCQRAGAGRRIAWLSLDEGDNDPARFLSYLIAALQTVVPNIGEGLLAVLQSPQPPLIEPVLTSLLNEITAIPDNLVLVLDDYHVLDARPVDHAITFLLEHLPTQMHLVILTREDPYLPLPRLRARGQLIELRAADLRFTLAEAAEFLNQVMGLNLSAGDIAALETRTEGWIAGLQLAALALQGTISRQAHPDTAGFIQSFTGSHHFVLDYLLEEVLQQQSEGIQKFLLHTSILDRLCGPLCDAILLDVSASGKAARAVSSAALETAGQVPTFPNTAIPEKAAQGTSAPEEPALERAALERAAPAPGGQQTLEYLERANLFIIPLDSERRWYRYHHLFADLLRQRLQQHPLPGSAASSKRNTEALVKELHIRASQWFEDNGLDLEAFQHAASAGDVDRAEQLIQGKGIPLHFRGAVTAILEWLGSLPAAVLDARPSLWWRYAGLLLINGQTTGVEEKLQAAEAALAAASPPGEPAGGKTRNLIGQIAAARATLALTRYDAETMQAESRRALEYLHPDSLSSRANAYWTLGYACFFQGDRTAARQALTEAVALSQAAGAVFTTILATIGLGNLHEAANELYQAAETYRRVLHLTGDQPLQIIHEAHLGLARVLYEWNDLDAAEQHGQQSLLLARQYDRVIDRFIICEVFLARLKLAQGDAAGAAAVLSQASQSVHQHNFQHRMAEVAAGQVQLLLQQGSLEAASNLAQAHDLPTSQARVHLAQGNAPAAMEILEAHRQQIETKGWEDERLKVVVLQAVANYTAGEKSQAVQLLGEALALAEPGGFIRIFVDEGPAMMQLISEAAAQGVMPGYTARLLAVFESEQQKSRGRPDLPPHQPLIEPLSQRELEVLQLIAQGLSNREISEQLFLALDTVKGHNRNIFDKLQVNRRTEAVARARQLGLL